MQELRSRYGGKDLDSARGQSRATDARPAAADAGPSTGSSRASAVERAMASGDQHTTMRWDASASDSDDDDGGAGADGSHTGASAVRAAGAAGARAAPPSGREQAGSGTGGGAADSPDSAMRQRGHEGGGAGGDGVSAEPAALARAAQGQPVPTATPRPAQPEGLVSPFAAAAQRTTQAAPRPPTAGVGVETHAAPSGERGSALSADTDSTPYHSAAAHDSTDSGAYGQAPVVDSAATNFWTALAQKPY